MNTIYLVGFMGCGKTSVGNLLSKQLEVPPYDVDTTVEKLRGQTIKEIFASEGEEAFRNYESLAIRQLPLENAVVMTGGGAVVREENLSYMKSKGTVIYLKTSFPILWKRLMKEEERNKRPILLTKTKEEVFELYQMRNEFYEKSDVTIITDHLTAEEICIRILDEIKPFNSWK
ncbi:shikimate kinase [Fictibacillus barbaricus]|uniref:Shikimate kinase n=1 Tax=Fictibacillus barbaricus TaxID=182136 RepID=A0ABU1TZT9_9BACL|nr:shikimate kinase [Fictibacillus barbaricus]MDR7072712.1 shikimate kinase [Fictibacillus barbaricus]